jgi:hypothetical protein
VCVYSTTRDVLRQLKSNLDLRSIKSHAIYRISGTHVRRLELDEVIKNIMVPDSDTQEVRLLLRMWIFHPDGLYEDEVMQFDVDDKESNTALWLKYMEISFMVMSGKYYLTEEESIMLGCLKCQVCMYIYTTIYVCICIINL